MATGRYYLCPQCKTRTWAQSLFYALQDAAYSKAHLCPSCNRDLQLELSFTFGLDAGTYEYHLVGAYLPEPPVEWNDNNGKKVEFFPFLIVLKHVQSSSKSVWLPYWHLHHIDEVPRKKYGQWAPHMDMKTFGNLIEKGRKDGHF